MDKENFRYVIVPNDAGTTDAARKTWFLNEYLEEKAGIIKEAAQTAEEEKQRLAVLKETRGRIVKETQFIPKNEFKKKIANKDTEFLGSEGYELSQLCLAVKFELVAYLLEAYFMEKKVIQKKVSQACSFNGTTFLEEAKFLHFATFQQKANFDNATFQQEADFSFATFQREANFDNAIFQQEANFIGATFSEPAYFSDAIFSQEASFFCATFSQTAGFSDATFSQEADFSGTTFEKAVDFQSSTFKGNLHLTAEKINPKAEFNFDVVSLDEKSQVFFRDVVLPQKATRSGARLLKEFFTKKQDNILGDHFYRLEMDARLENLSWKKHFGEKLLLFIGKLSSDFGQKWYLPLFWIPSFTYFFYQFISPNNNFLDPILIVFFTALFSVLIKDERLIPTVTLALTLPSLIAMSDPPYDYSKITFAKFANPFTLAMPEELKVGWHQLLYLLSRLVNVGLIYQLIFALKRKTKR